MSPGFDTSQQPVVISISTPPRGASQMKSRLLVRQQRAPEKRAAGLGPADVMGGERFMCACVCVCVCKSGPDEWERNEET